MADVKLTRRDMLEVEKVAGESWNRLFPDGEPTAMGFLALGYIQERKAADGEFMSFEEWLDGEVTVEEEEPENPT